MMTLAADIATLGTYNATDITAAVTQAFDQLSLFARSTIVEDGSADWDRIAKYYAIYLLDRMMAQRRARTDSSIDMTKYPLITAEIKQLIKEMTVGSKQPEDLVISKYGGPSDDWFDDPS